MTGTKYPRTLRERSVLIASSQQPGSQQCAASSQQSGTSSQQPAASSQQPAATKPKKKPV